jgi:hypothetical protein
MLEKYICSIIRCLFDPGVIVQFSSIAILETKTISLRDASFSRGKYYWPLYDYEKTCSAACRVIKLVRTALTLGIANIV